MSGRDLRSADCCREHSERVVVIDPEGPEEQQQEAAARRDFHFQSILRRHTPV